MTDESQGQAFTALDTRLSPPLTASRITMEGCPPDHELWRVERQLLNRSFMERHGGSIVQQNGDWVIVQKEHCDSFSAPNWRRLYWNITGHTSNTVFVGNPHHRPPVIPDQFHVYTEGEAPLHPSIRLQENEFFISGASGEISPQRTPITVEINNTETEEENSFIQSAIQEAIQSLAEQGLTIDPARVVELTGGGGDGGGGTPGATIHSGGVVGRGGSSSDNSLVWRVLNSGGMILTFPADERDGVAEMRSGFLRTGGIVTVCIKETESTIVMGFIPSGSTYDNTTRALLRRLVAYHDSLANAREKSETSTHRAERVLNLG